MLGLARGRWAVSQEDTLIRFSEDLLETARNRNKSGPILNYLFFFQNNGVIDQQHLVLIRI